MLCVLSGEGSIGPDRYYLRYSVVYFFRGCSAKMSRGSDGLESIWDATIRQPRRIACLHPN
jgi:hypothetical protein